MSDRDKTSEPSHGAGAAYGTLREWIDKPWITLLILFGAMAALGLPLLWMSRGFRWWQKIFWTVVVMAYTVGLLAGTWWICRWAWETIQASLK